MLDFIQQLFNTFLNMSITGAYIITAVMIIRLFLRKAPKIFSYCLWIIPAIRLLLPFSFSSVLSVFNLISAPSESTPVNNLTSYSYIPENIGTMPVPEISMGINAADKLINPALPAADVAASVNPMQVIEAVAAVVWVIGIAAMLVYFIVSLIKVSKQIMFSTRLDGNVFECEKVRSPFVFGLIKPKIYLPCKMEDNSRGYVVLHEQTHIKRFDHITRIAAFAILALHWYNPLVWVAYKLMTRDMEMSCDERVLKTLGEQQKKDYGMTLVTIGATKRFITTAPLSFGENGVEERVVNILKFKKAKVIVTVLCVILCVAAGIVCLTNASKPKDEFGYYEEKIEEYIVSQNSSKDGLYVPAVEIIEMTEDKTAYCLMQAHVFESASYSDWLSGNFEKEIYEFKTNLDGIKSKNALIAVTAQINDSLVVTKVEKTEELPEKAENLDEIKDEIWNGIADNAQKAFDGAYGGKYKLTKADFSGKAAEKLTANAFELVEYGNNQILVVRFASTPQPITTPQSVYYKVNPSFSLFVKSGEDWITVPRKPNTGNNEETCVIQGGDKSGSEALYFCNLSTFVDGLSADEYKIDTTVEGPLGETLSAEIYFKTDGKKPSHENPELKPEALNEVEILPLTAKITSPQSGWICHGIGGNDSRYLSKEELQTVAQLCNETYFKPHNIPEEINPYYAYYVSIKEGDGRVYSFRMTHNLVVDSEGNYYTYTNPILYKTVLNLLDLTEPTTAAPVYDNDTPAVTKPFVQQKPQTTKNNQPAMSTTKPAGSPIIPVPTEPWEEYVLTDIKVSHESEDAEFKKIVALGFDYEGSYMGGPHFFWEFMSTASRDLYIKTAASYSMESTNYTLEKRNGGAWTACTPLKENSTAYNKQIKQNYSLSVIFPINRYFNSVENGEYRISVPFYYESGNHAGNLMIEFTLTRLTVTRADADEKIVSPLSVRISPMTSGEKYVYNIITPQETAQIVECCNSLSTEGNTINSNTSVSTFEISIIDTNNKEHVYYAQPDGTVICNNQVFKSDKLYMLAVNAMR